ncbi:MAG: helix-turn-helix domain-containing protein [Acidobacteriota bacterium]
MLSPKDYKEVERRYHDPKISAYEQRRCHALLLLSDGYPVEKVAELLRVSIERVQEWVNYYQQQGIAGLEEWR